MGGERPSRKRRKVEGYFMHNLLPFSPPWFHLKERKVRDNGNTSIKHEQMVSNLFVPKVCL